MAQLPARRNRRSTALIDPSREFEDLYDRMGQLFNMAFSDMPFGQMQMVNAPWVPLADYRRPMTPIPSRSSCRGAQGPDQCRAQ